MTASIIKVDIEPWDTEASLAIESNHRKIRYTVVFTEAVYNTETVLMTEGMPYVGMVFPWNDSLRCKSITLSSEENCSVWRADAEFSADTMVIEEGYGYDFRPTPILKEVAVRGAYWYNNPAKTDEEIEYKDSPDYPIQVSTGNPPGDPVMGVQVNTQFTWWQIESNAMTPLIESGDIYQFIGSINDEPITICGQNFKAYELELKEIVPEIYFYRPPNSTRSERRYKVTYTVEKDLKTHNARILDQDYQAMLRLPKTPGAWASATASASGTASYLLVKRNIRLSDLPENKFLISLKGADDDDVNDPVKLDGKGKILEKDGTPVYIEYQHKPSWDWATVFDFASQQKVS